jgi:hypothetical protein
MAFQKLIKVDRIEVVGDFKHVQVRKSVQIVEDGVVISQTFERDCIAPGVNYSAQPEDVQAICASVHTQDLIEAYQAATAAQGV